MSSLTAPTMATTMAEGSAAAMAATTLTTRPATPCMLGLPRELRNRIYEYAECWHHVNNVLLSAHTATAHELWTTGSALIRTCRQLHDELTERLYGQLFVIDYRNDFPIGSQFPGKNLPVFGFLPMVQKLRLRVYIKTGRKISKQIDELEEILKVLKRSDRLDKFAFTLTFNMPEFLGADRLKSQHELQARIRKFRQIRKKGGVGSEENAKDRELLYASSVAGLLKTMVGTKWEGGTSGDA